MPTPDIEKYITMPDATQMFGAARETMLSHQAPCYIDIFRAHMITAHRLMRGKHVPATEQLDLIFAWPRTGIPNPAQHQFHRLIRITPIERVTFFPMMPWQHVMAHPPHQQARMPHHNGHAGTQQRADTRISLAEIYFARLQKNLDGMRRFIHQ